LIGLVPAWLIFNPLFGFVAVLGVIALSGMIMRNAAILVDQIDTGIAAGGRPSPRWSSWTSATRGARACNPAGLRRAAICGAR
jgi:multidrug efflux pump